MVRCCPNCGVADDDGHSLSTCIERLRNMILNLAHLWDEPGDETYDSVLRTYAAMLRDDEPRTETPKGGGDDGR